MLSGRIHSHVRTIFFLVIPPPPTSTLFPYTTLFRSGRMRAIERRRAHRHVTLEHPVSDELFRQRRNRGAAGKVRDRKSTRLNSSHANISYAVFCLKKKKRNDPTTTP